MRAREQEFHDACVLSPYQAEGGGPTLQLQATQKAKTATNFFTFRPQDFNFEGIVTIAQCSNMWYLSHIGVYDYHAPSQLGLK